MPNPKNIIPFQMKKGETRNPNGRPRKSTSLVIKELRSEGFVSIGHSEIKEIYSILLNCDEKTMRSIMEDQEQPMILRITIRHLLSKKGWEIIKDILDRAHGKPAQKVQEDSIGAFTLADGLVRLARVKQKVES